jgi:hypothetical protein
MQEAVFEREQELVFQLLVELVLLQEEESLFSSLQVSTKKIHNEYNICVWVDSLFHTYHNFAPYSPQAGVNNTSMLIKVCYTEFLSVDRDY